MVASTVKHLGKIQWEWLFKEKDFEDVKHVGWISPHLTLKIFALVIQIPFIVNKYFQGVSHLT